MMFFVLKNEHMGSIVTFRWAHITSWIEKLNIVLIQITNDEWNEKLSFYKEESRIDFCFASIAYYAYHLTLSYISETIDWNLDPIKIE